MNAHSGGQFLSGNTSVFKPPRRAPLVHRRAETSDGALRARPAVQCCPPAAVLIGSARPSGGSKQDTFDSPCPPLPAGLSVPAVCIGLGSKVHTRCLGHHSPPAYAARISQNQTALKLRPPGRNRPNHTAGTGRNRPLADSKQVSEKVGNKWQGTGVRAACLE
jgi:hypothetical protein